MEVRAETDKQKNLNKSSTVAKAFMILEELSSCRQPLTVTELSNLTGFDKTTTYRFLMTLVELGYVVRDESSRSFELSYKIISLGRNLLMENDVSEIILNSLNELSNITKETIHYAVLDGNETVVIQKVKGSQLVIVDFQIGDRSPLSFTSIGKAITAYQDNTFINKVIEQGLIKKTENSIIDSEQFIEELKRIRHQGYAIDNHEYSEDMRCIAVPIFTQNGIVKSGISISGPDSRFTMEKLKDLSIPMLEASSNLSKKLGGIPWE